MSFEEASRQFEDYLNRDDKPILCEKCSGKMLYVAGGRYACEKCGHEALDDFGKVKVYLDENGPSNAIVISKETGVPRLKVVQFLREGRMEVVASADGSIGRFCRMCGTAIRSGDYCKACLKDMIEDNIKGTYVGDAERMLHEKTDDKMRYLGKH